MDEEAINMERRFYASSALVKMHVALGGVSKAGTLLMASRAGRLTRAVCNAVFPFPSAFIFAFLSIPTEEQTTSEPKDPTLN